MTASDIGYQKRFERNMGIIDEEQQAALRETKVAVFGMGGVGGACFEILVRTGIGRFSIVDKDIFETSNANRQIFAFEDTIGQKKIDVAEKFAKKINPEVRIAKYETVTEQNVGEIVAGSAAVVQAIDELKPCIITSRRAREEGIPFIEGWALPYGNVRVFTPETPSLEETYGLPTAGRSVGDISDQELARMNLGILQSFGKIDGLTDYYGEDVIERIENNAIPSFAPMVWLSSVMMATETLKVLLKKGEVASAPDLLLFDPFRRRILKG